MAKEEKKKEASKEEIKKLIKIIDGVFNEEENMKVRQQMNESLNFFKGHYWPERVLDTEWDSEIFSNELFATVMTIAPMLTDNKPIWNISSMKPFLQPVANVIKLAGDAFWVQEDMETLVFKGVLDALVMKNAIFQVYFDPDKKAGGEASVELVDPRTYFQAPGFDDNWDAPFCGTITKESIWWIKQNFPETGKDVKPDGKDDESKVAGMISKVAGFFSRGSEMEEMSNQNVTVYRLFIRDTETVKKVIEATGGEKEEVNIKKYPNGRWMVFTKSGILLDDKAYPYNHGKPPYVFMYDYITPHSVWGMSENDQIQGMTLEYNLGLRKIAGHVRRYASKNWAVDSSSGIDHEHFKQTFHKGDQAYPVNPGSTLPKEIEVGPIDQTSLQFVNGMPALIQNITGVTDITKGMAGKKQRQSAHEVTALLETSYTRTRQRVRNLETALKRIYTLWVEIVLQFYTTTKDFTLKDNDGNREWFSYNNSPDYAKQMMQPDKPEEEAENEEEEADLKQQWQDYNELVEYIGDEEAVSFNFIIDIETNSTLPMDKQALANLALQLAQLGHIDNLSLLEMLKIPNAKKIHDRLLQEAQGKNAQAQGGPQQPPSPQPGGGNPVAAMMGAGGGQ